MPNPFLYKQTVVFQTIQFSIGTHFNCQTVLIQTIQFSVSSFNIKNRSISNNSG